MMVMMLCVRKIYKTQFWLEDDILLTLVENVCIRVEVVGCMV